MQTEIVIVCFLQCCIFSCRHTCSCILNSFKIFTILLYRAKEEYVDNLFTRHLMIFMFLTVVFRTFSLIFITLLLLFQTNIYTNRHVEMPHFVIFYYVGNSKHGRNFDFDTSFYFFILFNWATSK